jgi:hypothetical protein
MYKLYQNHEFLYERQKALIDFFSHQQDDFLSILEKEIATVQRKTKGIGYFVDAFKVVRSRSEVLDAVSTFRDTVRTVLDEVKEATVGMRGSFSYSPLEGGVRLRISGIPVGGFRLELDPGENSSSIIVRYKADGVLVERNVSSVSEKNGNSIIVSQRLLPASLMKRGGGFAAAGRNHSFTEATFDILVGENGTSPIRSVWVTPLAVDAQEIRATLVDTIAQSEFKNEFSIIPEYPEPSPIVFSGTKLIDGFQTIERDLIIEPGTKLIFSEGAGLKLLGRVSAIGTPDAPITLTSSTPGLPWGAVVLKDHGSDGSQFRHCLFEYGSGIKGDTYEYTAMLSIHNVNDVLIKDSTFSNSRITDDMLHVVYSTIRIEDSLFENSLSDAVDLDITTAEIIGSRFSKSGNDAIDLMTSKVFISNSEMSGSGDKGVSIGENSLLFVVGSRFLNNHIAVESKDSSSVAIFNSLISDNALGLHAYQKNWQYGTGGQLTVSKSVIENNLKTASVGKKSKIVVSDSFVDKIPTSGRLPSFIDVDSIHRNQAQSALPTRIEGINEHFTDYLSRIDSNTRGVLAN